MRYHRKRGVHRRNSRLMIAILLMAIVTVGITALSKSEAAVGMEDRYVHVVVKEGDSLWAIARMYGPRGEDIRKTVWALRRDNDLAAGIVYPGQIIKVHK
ncbi:MAG: LysM peptidoglycan-binding domain-containing protein [Bacillota bacterium]